MLILYLPHLNKAQRQEEDNIQAEKVAPNKCMSSKDRSKNLEWVVVGPRGAKRLVKKPIDYEEEMAAGQRSLRGPAAVREPRPRAEEQLAGPEEEMLDVEGKNGILPDAAWAARGGEGGPRM